MFGDRKFLGWGPTRCGATCATGYVARSFLTLKTFGSACAFDFAKISLSLTRHFCGLEVVERSDADDARLLTELRLCVVQICKP